MNSETTTKLDLVRSVLGKTGFGAAMFWHRNNFSWLTGGKDNHILHAGPVGVAGLLVTPDQFVCITDTIEAPRFRDEELAGLGIDVVSFPWHDPSAGKKLASDLVGNHKLCADVDKFSLNAEVLPAELVRLRWQLNDAELARYRLGGRIAADSLEEVCNVIWPGMSEHEIAAEIDFAVRKRDAKAVVNLVAVDHRIEQFRHPIPTTTKLKQVAMLVVCSEYAGLISNVTRFVHFGKATDAFKQKVQAVADVDATINLATKPGKVWKDIFSDLQAAYAKAHHDGQWQFHHQGGSTGYAGREGFARPSSTEVVLDRQAYAWNPSVVGFKSEDTVFVTQQGVEVLTPHSNNWPTVVGRAPAGTLPRAGVLER
jgi:Xaa-Pro aminopeptidase